MFNKEERNGARIAGILEDKTMNYKLMVTLFMLNRMTRSVH